MVKNKKKLIIISGGSGSGKSTVERILAQDPNIVRIISTTTRSQRAGEENEKDYYFITKELFEQELNKGKFIQHIIYDGNYYGIHGKVIELILEKQNKHAVVIVNIKSIIVLKKFCQEKDYQTMAFWFQTLSLEKTVENMRKRGASDKEIINRLIIEEKERKMLEDNDFLIDYFLKIKDLEEAVNTIKAKLKE